MGNLFSQPQNDKKPWKLTPLEYRVMTVAGSEDHASQMSNFSLAKVISQKPRLQLCMTADEPAQNRLHVIQAVENCIELYAIDAKDACLEALKDTKASDVIWESVSLPGHCPVSIVKNGVHVIQLVQENAPNILTVDVYTINEIIPS